MEYGLACPRAVIDDHAVALCIQAFFIGDLLCRKEEVTDEFAVRFGHAVDFRDMPLGNDERMHGSLGIDVLKGDDRVVFEYNFRRDFLLDDLAEDAVRISAHLPSPFSVSEKLLKKQQREPVWQAGPVCSTLTRRVSWSQS